MSATARYTPVRSNLCKLYSSAFAAQCGPARECRWVRPVFTDRTHRRVKLLVGLLALLGHLGATAGRLCFGFLLRGVALCLRLVLLGLALAGEVVTAGHRAGGFLGPAL